MVLAKIGRMAGYANMAKNAYQLKKASDPSIQEHARKQLINRMGRLRGLPQKVGQMLSLSLDDEKSESDAVDQYSQLQESAEPLPLEQLIPVIEKQWGCSIDERLATIEPSGIAASLGQVHRAVTVDGTEVAVKIQFPGIRKAVYDDLKHLGWLSIPLGNLKRGFDLGGYRQTLLEDLECELDYRKEAEQHLAFAKDLTHSDFAIIPKVIQELSTELVLVTTWEEGQCWQEVKETWDDASRRQLANYLVQLFVEQLLEKGRIQADWHPGNFRFRRENDQIQVVMYDLGCMFHATDQQRWALAELVETTRSEEGEIFSLFLALGFDHEFLSPLAHKLPAVARTLFAPFVAEHPFDLQEWDLSQKMEDILGDDRWNFRIAGPANLIFLMRAFHGVVYYLKESKMPVFWSRPFKKVRALIEDELSRLELPEVKEFQTDFSSIAKHLKTRVVEDGRTKVEMTQYASAIDRIDELLDQELKDKIEEQGIDLKQIVSDVRSSGYLPGSVFELQNDSKTVTVWLE